MYIVLKVGVDGDGVGVGDGDIDTGGDGTGGGVKLTVLQLIDELNEAQNGKVLTSVRA